MKSVYSDVSIVIPIFNEEESLAGYLDGLVPYCLERDWKLILVNDGSTDGTEAILKVYAPLTGVEVITHKLNRGYGGATKSGIRHARTDYVVTLDGDGQHYFEDIERLLALALERDADLVIGKRDKKKSSMYRRVGKSLIHRVARLIMHIPVEDLNSGFKLYRTDLVKRYIRICPDTMAFSQFITLLFINQRDLVLEHPIRIRKRNAGISKINFKDAFEAVVEITGLILVFKPLRVFLSLSFVSVFIGLGWGIRFVLLGRGISVGSMLAIVVGVLFFIFGYLSKQISAIYLSMVSPREPVEIQDYHA